MEKILSKEMMLNALQSLDHELPSHVQLIMGGGGSMILAHAFPLATSDIDAIPKGMSIEELDVYVKIVSMNLMIPGDWLNPYFSTFSHVLPESFSERLITVFNGKKLTVNALGKEDMLIMKCFAHREKDIPHAKQLIKKKANILFVEKHLESLVKNKVPGAPDALDFLDDLMEQMDERA